MTAMRFFFILFLLPCFAFSQSEELNTRTIELSPFINLKVYSGIHIELIPSASDSLVIKAETPDEVVSVLKGNTLKLRLGLENLLQKSKTEIEIYHSQPIDLIDLSQGSQMKAKGTIEQTSMTLILQEGSKAEVDLKLEKLSAKVQSGSKLFPTGYAKNSIISCSSGGTCEADQLLSEQADVKASLGSVVYVNASQLVDAKASVNATIRVHGSPVKLITKESVGGRVLVMD